MVWEPPKDIIFGNFFSCLSIIPTILLFGDNLVFEEGNVPELVACVQKLLDDPQLYADLASRGRQRVLENYTQERIAQQTYEVYQEMLAH